MLSWAPLSPQLRSAVQGDDFWEARLAELDECVSLPYKIHLAIFVEPYLQFILEGRKTVESRFSKNRCAPYQRVMKGDVLLLKRSSGPIIGLCQVANVWFYHLDVAAWDFIREQFTEALCAQDPSFWSDRAHTSFATLMRVHRVRRIDPIEYVKRDRRGWVILTNSHPQQLKLDSL